MVLLHEALLNPLQTNRDVDDLLHKTLQNLSTERTVKTSTETKPSSPAPPPRCTHCYHAFDLFRPCPGCLVQRTLRTSAWHAPLMLPCWACDVAFLKWRGRCDPSPVSSSILAFFALRGESSTWLLKTVPFAFLLQLQSSSDFLQHSHAFFDFVFFVAFVWLLYLGLPE